MQTHFYRITVLAFFVVAITASIMKLGAAGTGGKPQNYNEIKGILDFYATADDMMDDKLIAARESLRTRNEEAVPALLILFTENTDDRYRFAIVDALQYNKGRKDDSVAFLLEQLQPEAVYRKDKYWIAKAIDFLTAAAPEQARKVSRKALNAQSDFVKQAAISSLASVGTRSDVETLRSFANMRRSSQTDHKNDGVLAKADAAISQISERESPER